MSVYFTFFFFFLSEPLPHFHIHYYTSFLLLLSVLIHPSVCLPLSFFVMPFFQYIVYQDLLCPPSPIAHVYLLVFPFWSMDFLFSLHIHQIVLLISFTPGTPYVTFIPCLKFLNYLAVPRNFLSLLYFSYTQALKAYFYAHPHGPLIYILYLFHLSSHLILHDNWPLFCMHPLSYSWCTSFTSAKPLLPLAF